MGINEWFINIALGLFDMHSLAILNFDCLDKIVS